MKHEDQKSFCWVVVKNRTVFSGWSKVYRKMSKPFLCISILVGVALWVWVSLGSFFDGCHWAGHPHCPSEMYMYGYISNNDTWSHTKKQKYKPNVWVPCPCCLGHGRPSCLQWYHIKPALSVCVLCVTLDWCVLAEGSCPVSTEVR